MFCPNCGKDCGAFKFCPECGQELRMKMNPMEKMNDSENKGGNSKLVIDIKLIIGKVLSTLGSLCYFFAILAVACCVGEGFQSGEIGMIFIFAFLGTILQVSAMIIPKKAKVFAPPNKTLSGFYVPSTDAAKTKILHCPYCGANSAFCGNRDQCEYCGAPLSREQVLLIADDTVQSVCPRPPFTLKRVRWGTLEFSSESMRVHIRLPKKPITDKRIPYDEIFGVSYVPATKWLNGFLCVREWKDRYTPIPKNHLESTLGNVTTWLEVKDNDDFLRIYEFLKQYAEINAMRRQN